MCSSRVLFLALINAILFLAFIVRLVRLALDTTDTPSSEITWMTGLVVTGVAAALLTLALIHVHGREVQCRNFIRRLTSGILTLSGAATASYIYEQSHVAMYSDMDRAFQGGANMSFYFLNLFLISLVVNNVPQTVVWLAVNT